MRRTGSIKTCCFVALFAWMLSSALPVLAADPLVPTTEQEKTNYSIGVNMIKNFQQQGVDVKFEMLVQGMKDALSGGKLQMSDEEIKKTLLALQNEVRRRQKMAPIIAQQEGQTFLLQNGKKDGVVTTPSGLQYSVIKAGSGKKPVDNDMVLVNYRGTLLNGSEFDRSYPGKPVTFSVREGGGMPGLSEALKLMPVGSSWRLFIPAKLAYGERGRMSVVGSPVGPNETVIVDVELLSIQ